MKTYLDLVILAHNQVVNKLHMHLNNAAVRVHFKAVEAHKVDFGSKKVSTGDSHLYRSFRVIGLRKQKLKSSSSRRCNGANSSFHRYHHHHHHHHKSSSATTTAAISNFLLQNDFNDVVDIRGAFDIRQFQNKTGYDCFIECEFNYFRIFAGQHHHLCNHVHPNLNTNLFNSMRGFTLHHHSGGSAGGGGCNGRGKFNSNNDECLLSVAGASRSCGGGGGGGSCSARRMSGGGKVVINAEKQPPCCGSSNFHQQFFNFNYPLHQQKRVHVTARFGVVNNDGDNFTIPCDDLNGGADSGRHFKSSFYFTKSRDDSS